MNLKTIGIEYENAESLEKTLALEIACFRAKGGEALVFFLENTESHSTFRNSSTKILKKLKKQRIIQTFIFGEEISEVKTETQYLLNKLPGLPDILADFEISVCVKL